MGAIVSTNPLPVGAGPEPVRAAARQIAVVSGKGGTGKTSVVASFAALAEGAVLADCDVDAANLHLLLHPEILERSEFRGANAAVRDASRCSGSGECERLCRFEAITPERVDARRCQGCGLCVLGCPKGALRLEEIACGEVYSSVSPYGPMAHARLYPGGESSGRLVTEVRRRAEALAVEAGLPLILIDGPPGIACAVTAAIADADLAVVVTEPTPAGHHDLERVLRLIRHFGIPAAVVINKADLDTGHSRAIRETCAETMVPVVGEIPFDQAVTRAIAAARPLVEIDHGPAAAAIRDAWRAVRGMVGGEAGDGWPAAWRHVSRFGSGEGDIPMGKITALYKGNMLFESKMGNHTVVIDVPPAMGGTDRGPTPPELFIASLGSCVGAFVADYCGRAGLDARDMTVDVTFDKAENPTRLINVKVRICLPNGDCGERAKAILRVAEHCPVHETITAMDGVEIELVGKESAAG